jgi:hypothetical protein
MRRSGSALLRSALTKAQLGDNLTEGAGLSVFPPCFLEGVNGDRARFDIPRANRWMISTSR